MTSARSLSNCKVVVVQQPLKHCGNFNSQSRSEPMSATWSSTRTPSRKCLRRLTRCICPPDKCQWQQCQWQQSHWTRLKQPSQHRINHRSRLYKEDQRIKRTRARIRIKVKVKEIKSQEAQNIHQTHLISAVIAISGMVRMPGTVFLL